MNDKFKFRAWDKEKEFMHYFTFDDIIRGALFRILSKPETFGLKLSDCEITQSTGEKDNNGKLIYEGDIIQHKDKDEIPFEVYFSSGLDSLFPWHYEILGNIFQNPELLTK